jgi:hypothetical protein
METDQVKVSDAITPSLQKPNILIIFVVAISSILVYYNYFFYFCTPFSRGGNQHRSLCNSPPVNILLNPVGVFYTATKQEFNEY